jgi:pimeloyl-ACP methyl ester carboxylesterase
MSAGEQISKSAKPRRFRAPGAWIARVVLVLLALGGFFLSVSPLGRAMARAALLLPSLITGSATAPLTLLGVPTHYTEMTIPSRSGPVFLEVYAPTSPPPPVPGVRGGLLIIPGVGDNRANPQLVNLSQSLAHTGLVVMVMRTPTLINYQLSPADSDAVVQAFDTLAHWPDVGADRVGIVCFSAGGTLGSLAAADPRIRDRGTFLVLFGGYFNVTTLLRDFGRRALIVDGQALPWHPRETSLRVLANTFASTLPPSEGARLAKAFAPGGAPLTDAELAQLSPPAAAAYHLLAGDQPERVEENLAALSPSMRVLSRELSPSTVVGQIHMPVYLLHDRNDAFIPFTQSRDFAAALTRLDHPYEFVEFSSFEHVEIRPGRGLGPLLIDGVRLFGILSKVLLIGS